MLTAMVQLAPAAAEQERLRQLLLVEAAAGEAGEFVAADLDTGSAPAVPDPELSIGEIKPTSSPLWWLHPTIRTLIV
jgi:hypothetical protein